MNEQNHPNVIKIRNAHIHNLKHIDVVTDDGRMQGNGSSYRFQRQDFLTAGKQKGKKPLCFFFMKS